MPTGYTDCIARGATFEEFVWGCARAFGALVSMRDDPSDASIPEKLEPSTYHQEQVAVARKELDRLNALADEPADAEAEAKATFDRQMVAWEDDRATETVLQERYEALLEQAKAWQPPSPEHQGLKDFMVEQLQRSIEFDHKVTFPPVLLSGLDYLLEAYAKALKDVIYHIREDAAEERRVTKRNRWLQQLRESVPLPEKGMECKD